MRVMDTVIYALCQLWFHLFSDINETAELLEQPWILQY